MKRIFAVLLAVVMVFAMLSGCSKETKQDAAGDGAIKIGGIGPTTGDAAIYGQAVQRAAEIAFEEINENGDIKFEFKFEDDVNDAETAVNAYGPLMDWGMQAMIGTVTSTPCAAVAAEANKDKLFMLTPSASSTDCTAASDYLFQLCFTDPNQGALSAEYINDHDMGTTIGVIYNNATPYSSGIYDTFKKQADELGMEIAYTATFASDTESDFSAQLNGAKAAGVDVLFLPIYYQAASLIISQATQMGFNPTYFGVDGMDGILTMKGFDTSLAEGVYLLTPFSADAADEKTQNFVKKYEEKYGETPNQFAADAYDCAYAIYEACKKYGITADMTAEEICEKLTEGFSSGDFTFSGITGSNMVWSESGEVTKSPMAVVIKDGVYTSAQ